MDFIIKENLILKGKDPATTREVKRLLTMPNPKYDEAVKMGRWTGNLEPELMFYTDADNGLECPRGAAGQIYRICQQHGERINYMDRRRVLPEVDFRFHGTLHGFQKSAVDSCLSKDFGLLAAPTGSGKTVMAMAMIAARRQPVLIVVHTKELLHQWLNRIGQFLKIPKDEIGVIGSGKFTVKPVTVAMVQTLVKHAGAVAKHFGYLILDECHRAPAMQYVNAITQFDCRFMTGLSATPYRRDGLSKVIFWHIGDVTASVEKADLLDAGNLCPAEVVWTRTGFDTRIDVSTEYSRALSELTEDYARNRLICEVVSTGNGYGVSLILSDRKRHCDTLAAILKRDYGITAKVLTGAVSAKERAGIVDDLEKGRCKYLIATGQLIGEGFDLPAISSMFLATPIKFHGRVIQYIGRAMRSTPGKDRAFIYDFIDKNPVFLASAKARKRTYYQQNIEG